ncbi:flagellar hook-basal body complex protein FliE [Kineococcus gynurae]|uniref:Flagellar hook-basal body complex protein FliE n=1 Tax=Kineococcus gynurae TaxID=452979 RepID=A0ABV5LR60_9ACTN
MSVESIGSISSSLGTLATGFGQGIADTDNAQATRGVSTTVGTAPGAGSISPLSSTAGTSGVSGVGSSDGTDFASMLSGGIDKLQGLQSNADTLALKAATGDLTNVHDYMIASNEAQLATQLTVAVRNKAVEAFNEIMRMQL